MENGKMANSGDKEEGSAATEVNPSFEAYPTTTATAAEEQPCYRRYDLPPYIHRPCFTSMQTGMYLIGGGEASAYLVILAVYTTVYKKYLDPQNLQQWDLVLSQAGFGGVESETAEKINYLANLCMAQIITCAFYILSSGILIIGAFKRNIPLCVVYMFLISCFMLARVIVVIMTPIRVFQWGTIWMLVEVYFLYSVGCFIREVHFFPQGYAYKHKRPPPDFELLVNREFSSTEEGRFSRFRRLNTISANYPVVYYQTLAEKW